MVMMVIAGVLLVYITLFRIPVLELSILVAQFCKSDPQGALCRTALKMGYNEVSLEPWQ